MFRFRLFYDTFEKKIKTTITSRFISATEAEHYEVKYTMKL